MQKFSKRIISFIKSFHWTFLIGLGIFCLLGAIINNIRVPEENSVEWIGSQEVLAKPDEVL